MCFTSHSVSYRGETCESFCMRSPNRNGTPKILTRPSRETEFRYVFFALISSLVLFVFVFHELNLGSPISLVFTSS